MAEYIERSEAIEFTKQYTPTTNGETTMQCVERSLLNVPSADVVEVVRCSECKHHHNPMRCALWYGTLGDNEHFLEHGKDFYCAFGERRSDNG